MTGKDAYEWGCCYFPGPHGSWDTLAEEWQQEFKQSAHLVNEITGEDDEEWEEMHASEGGEV